MGVKKNLPPKGCAASKKCLNCAPNPPPMILSLHSLFKNMFTLFTHLMATEKYKSFTNGRGRPSQAPSKPTGAIGQDVKEKKNLREVYYN